MNNLKRLAHGYRLRAKELRTIANTYCTEETRKVLSEIAYKYDLMANAADAIERSYREHFARQKVTEYAGIVETRDSTKRQISLH